MCSQSMELQKRIFAKLINLHQKCKRNFADFSPSTEIFHPISNGVAFLSTPHGQLKLRNSSFHM